MELETEKVHDFTKFFFSFFRKHQSRLKIMAIVPASSVQVFGVSSASQGNSWHFLNAGLTSSLSSIIPRGHGYQDRSLCVVDFVRPHCEYCGPSRDTCRCCQTRWVLKLHGHCQMKKQSTNLTCNSGRRTMIRFGIRYDVTKTRSVTTSLRRVSPHIETNGHVSKLVKQPLFNAGADDPK